MVNRNTQSLSIMEMFNLKLRLTIMKTAVYVDNDACPEGNDLFESLTSH